MTRQEKHGDSKGKRMAIPETHVRFPRVSRPERVVRAARCKGSSVIMWFWPSDPAPEILVDSKISYKIARHPPRLAGIVAFQGTGLTLVPLIAWSVQTSKKQTNLSAITLLCRTGRRVTCRSEMPMRTKPTSSHPSGPQLFKISSRAVMA